MTKDPKKRKRKRRLRRFVLLLLLLLAAAAVVYFYAWPKMKAEATVTYDAYTARTGTISNALSFSGSVAVKNSETLTSDGTATVRKIYVEEGQKVQRNERLMRLSDGATVKAGFDGEINEISVEEGDDVSAGASLIQVVDFENMTISMRVDEYAISDLFIGQACTVTITALGETFDSQISRINRIPSGSGNTAYYTVTVELNVTGSVLPGMQADISIPLEEAKDAVILDMDALSFGRNNSAYVLIKDENGAMQQLEVEVGVDNDNYVAILSGLKDGDTVYKQAEEQRAATGIMSLFSNLGGGMPGGGNFDMNSMPDFGSGGFGGGGNFGGGGGGFGGGSGRGGGR